MWDLVNSYFVDVPWYQPDYIEVSSEETKQLNMRISRQTSGTVDNGPAYSDDILDPNLSLEKAKVLYWNIIEKYGDKNINYFTVFKEIIRLFGEQTIIQNFKISYAESVEYEHTELVTTDKDKYCLNYDLENILKYMAKNVASEKGTATNTDLLKFLDRANTFAKFNSFSRPIKKVEIQLLSDQIKNFVAIILNPGEFKNFDSIIDIITARIGYKFKKESSAGTLTSISEFNWRKFIHLIYLEAKLSSKNGPSEDVDSEDNELSSDNEENKEISQNQFDLKRSPNGRPGSISLNKSYHDSYEIVGVICQGNGKLNLFTQIKNYFRWDNDLL